ncbi:hypothetical protein, partial [Acinetobacter bereziniae]|uniref:hypothetical protein n=1 Tax=Acinetobacter bereziniae TaxID=106648 RepID=UPI001C2EE575
LNIDIFLDIDLLNLFFCAPGLKLENIFVMNFYMEKFRTWIFFDLLIAKHEKKKNIACIKCLRK